MIANVSSVFVAGRQRLWRLYARHRLDISTGDLLYGLMSCVWADRRSLLQDASVASRLGDRGLVCLSVRTGLDLLLEALALPAEDEVIVSAITHPDILRIIESHGLVVVPADLDTETLAPRRESLEAALSNRSRLLLVAHLFGGHVDLAYPANFARDNGLLLVEDCAQSFRGPEGMGQSEADVSMYSFGQIKTSTALGGAILRVEDPSLLA
jgi:perosamine synthetase